MLIVAIAALGTPVYHFRGPPSGISTNLGSAMQSHQDRHRNRLHAGTVTARRNERAASAYQRFRFMTELRSLLSTWFIDPLASLGFCPMRGSDGVRLVFERSLLLLLKPSIAPRSKAPLVVTSDGPPIELPTTKLPVEPPEAPPCANASVELRDNAVINVLSFI